MKCTYTPSELKYQALAKERTAAALRGQPLDAAERRVAAALDRLFRWRKVDSRYAARQAKWAREALRANCE